MDGFEAGEFIGLDGRDSRVRGGLLRCLHFLTCSVCNPPPEFSDSARLALAFLVFGCGASLLTAVEEFHGVGLAYCLLGVARLRCRRALLAATGIAGSVVLMSALLPSHMQGCALVLLVLLSELCWLESLRKVLDLQYEVFVSTLFLFLGVYVTFGFYPLLMQWGPVLAESPEVHETVNRVVTHAAHVAEHKGAGSSPATALGAAPGPHETSAGLVLAQALPLLLLLVIVPALAFVILMYWWMFQRMGRMLLAVSLVFVMWMAAYAGLLLLHVGASRDLIGKGVLASACIIIYHSFAQMIWLDERSARLGLLCVFAAFVATFFLDQVLPCSRGTSYPCPHLLFAFTIACKVTFSTTANWLEGGGGLKPEHLLPVWPELNLWHKLRRRLAASARSFRGPLDAESSVASVPLSWAGPPDELAEGATAEEARAACT